MIRSVCPISPTLVTAGEGSVNTPIITIDGVSKSFGALEVLKDLSFDVAPGEIDIGTYFAHLLSEP